MMESVLYKGKVRHTRLEPFRHSFSYRVFYGLFDIDNLKALDERFRWFSLDRFNLIGFHMGDSGSSRHYRTPVSTLTAVR
jgi:DUF1365 family protein